MSMLPDTSEKGTHLVGIIFCTLPDLAEHNGMPRGMVIEL
jgi:hypothetical protein